MAMLAHRPAFDASGAAALARDLFGVSGRAQPLTSERDQNFAIDAPFGRFVLKIANALEDRAVLEAENGAMAHLAARGVSCPRPVDVGGQSIFVEPGGHAVRLLTWVPGVPMGSIKRHSDALLADVGRVMGQVDRALATFDHPAIHRSFHWDLTTGLDTIAARLPLVRDAALRGLIDRETDHFARAVGPRVSACRRSAVHNDANDYNVLVGGGHDLWTRNQQVTGIIDFGDMVHGWTVADLAVAAAYIVLAQPDPLHASVTT